MARRGRPSYGLVRSPRFVSRSEQTAHRDLIAGEIQQTLAATVGVTNEVALAAAGEEGEGAVAGEKSIEHAVDGVDRQLRTDRLGLVVGRLRACAVDGRLMGL